MWWRYLCSIEVVTWARALGGMSIEFFEWLERWNGERMLFRMRPYRVDYCDWKLDLETFARESNVSKDTATLQGKCTGSRS